MSNKLKNYGFIFFLLLVNQCSISPAQIKAKTNLKSRGKKGSKTLQMNTSTLHVKGNIICNSTNCNGVCSDASTCRCKSGYVHVANDLKSTKYCSYKQKNQLTAVMLELLLPFGGGHFYGGRVFFGLTKICVLLSPLIVLVIAFSGMIISDKFLLGGAPMKVYTAFILFFGFLSLVWWMTDLVLLVNNKYLDGNDIPVVHW